ncbi:hypothetical protein GCM10022223_43430 [Kineosporia mesophila]|uniref:Uncharacterized protein n=1 Tax=Kineosporia mesophila TaxID=566012 RepID=A0ABP7A1D9_9ACTN|nr:hypothetical protein [Kineosporia mesophila]MCD5353228.1 hypothetical protein [Kineosporia mesophila]
MDYHIIDAYTLNNGCFGRGIREALCTPEGARHNSTISKGCHKFALDHWRPGDFPQDPLYRTLRD